MTRVDRQWWTQREHDAARARELGWLSVIPDSDEMGPDYYGVPPGGKTAERIPHFDMTEGGRS